MPTTSTLERVVEEGRETSWASFSEIIWRAWSSWPKRRDMGPV